MGWAPAPNPALPGPPRPTFLREGPILPESWPHWTLWPTAVATITPSPQVAGEGPEGGSRPRVPASSSSTSRTNLPQQVPGLEEREPLPPCPQPKPRWAPVSGPTRPLHERQGRLGASLPSTCQPWSVAPAPRSGFGPTESCLPPGQTWRPTALGGGSAQEPEVHACSGRLAGPWGEAPES